MWSVPYLESPATGPNNETIAQCCAFQRLGNIPQGEDYPKAPHYRFLCWVMLFRTLDLGIDKRERLTCPLSSCEKTFEDQQYLELVNHVSSCSYLERGLYDCPYCQKEESFCWELPYTVDDKEERVKSASGTLPGHLASHNAHPSVRTNSDLNMNINHSGSGEPDQSHLFNNQYAEFERDTFPEVFVSTEGRPSYSPGPIMDPHKRKYSEFEDEETVEPFAEFSNDTLPQTTTAYSPYNYMPPAMTFELPSSNVAGHHSVHLSPRTSPEIMQRHSPQLMQQALEMNLTPFPMDAPISPGFASNPMQQSASPQDRSRALSNASTIGGRSHRSQHSQHSQHSQQSPRLHVDTNGTMELMGSSRSRRGSSRASEASAGPGSSGASLPEEAEKSSLTCNECGRVFTGKAAWLPSNLQRHKRETHLGAPKTKCRICAKDFNRGHNLRHHMKAVHGEQP